MSVSDLDSAAARRDPGADPVALAELLAERHVAVVSSDRTIRERLAHELAVRLAVRPATVVVHMADGEARPAVAGAEVTTPDEPPLVEVLPTGEPARRHRTPWQDLDDARSGVLEEALATVALLARSAGPGWRILIWHDADDALAAAPRAFERVLELLLATTLEHEYLQPGDLVLQRLVLLGGPALAAAVADADGPFRRWSSGTRQVATDERGAADGHGGSAGDGGRADLGLDPRILELEHPRFEIVTV